MLSIEVTTITGRRERNNIIWPSLHDTGYNYPEKTWLFYLERKVNDAPDRVDFSRGLRVDHGKRHTIQGPA